MILSFVWDKTIDWLNAKNIRSDIPEEFADVYPEEKYKKSQAYLKASGQFSLVSSTISFLVLIVFYFAGGFAAYNDFVQDLG